MNFESRNPATGELLGVHPEHDKAEIEVRLQRAWDGWRRWSRTPLRERIAFLTRLAELLERGDQRIVVPEQHPVIELLVDPAFHDSLDVAEIADHVAVVERPGPDFDLSGRIVAVRMLADAVIVEQPMTVAELNTFGNRVHLVSW